MVLLVLDTSVILKWFKEEEYTEAALKIKEAKQKHHLLMDIIRKPFLMIIGDEDEFRRAIER